TRKLRTLERSARVALTATSLTETSYTTRRGGMPREVRPVLRTRGERYASKDVEGRILTARCQACHRGSVAVSVKMCDRGDAVCGHHRDVLTTRVYAALSYVARDDDTSFGTSSASCPRRPHGAESSTRPTNARWLPRVDPLRPASSGDRRIPRRWPADVHA